MLDYGYECTEVGLAKGALEQAKATAVEDCLGHLHRALDDIDPYALEREVVSWIFDIERVLCAYDYFVFEKDPPRWNFGAALSDADRKSLSIRVGELAQWFELHSALLAGGTWTT